MIPVVTPAEMRSIDAESLISTDVLIRRAGWAIALSARSMLGGTYGRRIAVVVGPGNNGADGKVAAELLRDRGAYVQVLEANSASHISNCDLVIDAAFGTGFRGEYKAPNVGTALVLAVDIPSGVSGDTGIACEGAVKAHRTVTFGAYKPGHLFADGPEYCGLMELIDIGLDVSKSRIQIVESSDVIEQLGKPNRESHKWRSAVLVVGGSAGMLGAASFVSRGAMRAGAGMVRLMVPGFASELLPVSEAVSMPIETSDWDDDVFAASKRTHAMVIGPGLGRSESTIKSVRNVVSKAQIPLVVDGDALFALGGDCAEIIHSRTSPTVITPHDGECKNLVGEEPGSDRIEAARLLAFQTGAVVLLKGSTTVIADSKGDVLLSIKGDARLATAGTGDVLAGIIGAFIAQGMSAHNAAAFAAYVHSAASKLGFSRGLIAGDLPEHVAKWISARWISADGTGADRIGDRWTDVKWTSNTSKER